MGKLDVDVMVLYNNMQGALNYEEYDIALEYARKIDDILGYKYYEYLVENVIIKNENENKRKLR